KVVTLQALLEYSTSIADKHNIDLLGGYSQEYTKYNGLQGYRKNFLNNEFSQLDVGTPSGMTNSGVQANWPCNLSLEGPTTIIKTNICLKRTSDMTVRRGLPRAKGGACIPLFQQGGTFRMNASLTL